MRGSPKVAESVTARLHHEDPDTGCVGELRVAAATLDRQGFLGRPQWDDLRRGVRPPPDHSREPGEWAHGWQYYATSASEFFFCEAVVLTNSSASDQAHVRSHSGFGSSHVFCGTPSSPEFRIELPFPHTRVGEVTSECGARLDSLGRYRAACPCSGRLRSRALEPLLECVAKLEPQCDAMPNFAR